MNSAERIPLLDGQTILLGVTGSIAIYKAVDLGSRLTQAGASVPVVMSAGGRQFVTPLTFQSVTGEQAYGEQDLWGDEAHVLHVGLAEKADLMIIAPATANTIAKIAGGQADSLLTLTVLAARCPVLVAPAMDVGMFENPATQANLNTLRERGLVIAGPAEGRMASGLVGYGRMLEADALVGWIRLVLGRTGPLAGKRVVVTAGGTQEALDPVRVLANRSSGKQGYALAQAAIDRGASVTLISGPSSLEPPVGVDFVPVVSAAEMKTAVLMATHEVDALLMAAAVADYRPAEPSQVKLKRTKGIPQVKLEATDDILAAVMAEHAQTSQQMRVVGFAAESGDLLANAREKLETKGVDLIVANDISSSDAGFEVDTNRVSVLDSEEVEELPLMSKAMVAERILDRVSAWFGEA